MEEHSFGVIPVFRTEGAFLFLLVQHNKQGPPAQRGGPAPRRSELGPREGGHWAFPKGHPEKGEAPPQTALRELREETGISDITLDTGRTFEERYRYMHDEKLRSKMVTYYIGFVTSTDVSVQPEEIGDFRWATYEEAQEQMTFTEGKRMLREAHEYISAQARGQ